MQDTILHWIFQLTKAHSKAVLLAFGVLTLSFGLIALNLNISTSQRALIPKNSQVAKDYAEFVEDFGAIDNLIVVLEGEPDKIRALSELLSAQYQSLTNFVKNTFHRADTSFFKQRALLFVPTEILRQAHGILEQQQTLIDDIAMTSNLPSLFNQIEESFSDKHLQWDPQTTPYLLKGLAWLFAEWAAWIDQPNRMHINPESEILNALGDGQEKISKDGYLVSYDNRMLFIFVQPTSANDDAVFLRPFVQSLRKTTERVFKQHPDLSNGVSVSFTGMPAHVLTEAETVFADVGRGGFVSIFLVLAIVLIGFRTRRKILFAFVPLACGMILSLGCIELVLGRLTLISAAFMAVMFGMSIDFGIYLIRRTEEELGLGKSLDTSIHAAICYTGKGVVTGGLTTALAFFAIALSDFAGFSELGTAAGMATLVCLCTVMLMLPSLMFCLGIEPKTYPVTRIQQIADQPSMRRWMTAIIALVLLLGLSGAWAIKHNTFDYNALHLLPENAESTLAQIRMQEQSVFQVAPALVLSNTIQEARDVSTRLKALSVVNRVESIVDMIPNGQEQRRKAIVELRPLLEQLSIQHKPAAMDLSTIQQQVRTLEAKLLEVEEMAFNAGRANLVAPLGAVLAACEELKSKLLSSPDAEVEKRSKAFEQALFANANSFLQLVHTWLEAKPISEESLPTHILERFKTPQGNYVSYVFPKHSIWDVLALDQFVKQVQAIAPRVTGFPITHQVFSRSVVRGFVQSMIYACMAILLVLALQFQRIRNILLALLPLCVSLLLLQLVVFCLKIPYNYANIAGFPVLMGYGVAYGVNMVQRWQESEARTAWATAYSVGKGVLLSATTTGAGLASLIFARHHGVAGFGIVLLAGIALCLFNAVVVLPVCMSLFYERNVCDRKRDTNV